MRIARAYKGWTCGCRSAPEAAYTVVLQYLNLTYAEVCLGCAAELSGVSKGEIAPQLSGSCPT